MTHEYVNSVHAIASSIRYELIESESTEAVRVYDIVLLNTGDTVSTGWKFTFKDPDMTEDSVESFANNGSESFGPYFDAIGFDEVRVEVAKWINHDGDPQLSTSRKVAINDDGSLTINEV